MDTLRSYALTLALASLAAGCTLNRSALVDDGGTSIDAPGRDAPRPDTAGLDVPDVDVPLDPPDAPLPEDGGACMPTSVAELLCDRRDDDCDGTIDDDNVCDCTALTVAGRAYLSCPPLSGFDAWEGACRKSAPGYDLAVFSSGAEQMAVLDAVRTLGISDPHWIGLNDFEVNGSYVWRDRSTTFTPTSIGADDPAKRFVILRDTSVYEELPGTDVHRVLCEVAALPTDCLGTEGPDCDGIDQDCNGFVDDGLACSHMCVSDTFWDHVYYACADARNHGEAIDDCNDVMAGLLSINHATEHEFVTRTVLAESWLGLAQATDAGAADADWQWADGFIGYGVPAMSGVRPWNSAEPDDNDTGAVMETNEENCGLLLTPAASSLFDDLACNQRRAYVCERRWTYAP